ncbi:unnamed protein product, partial [Bubo scandiacus]
TQEVTLALKGVMKIPAAAVHPEWSSIAKSGEGVFCQGTYKPAWTQQDSLFFG